MEKIHIEFMLRENNVANYYKYIYIYTYMNIYIYIYIYIHIIHIHIYTKAPANHTQHTQMYINDISFLNLQHSFWIDGLVKILIM